MSSVDWKAAIHYAQLVNIAYSVEPNALYTDATTAAIQNAGYEFVGALYGNELATDVSPHLGETVTYGFMARSPQGELVVAIRGTETILEWLHDFSFLFVPNPIHAGGGLTEDGFSAIYRSLRSAVDPNSPTAISAITSLVGAGGINTATITGHSLGAAVATLLALDVALNSGVKDITSYTYASPRVGEMFFEHTCDSTVPNTYRVVNQPDIVPKVPVFPYEHVGDELTLVPPMGSLQATFACWHSLDSYLWLMDRQAGGNTLAVDAGCRGANYPGPA
jgi:hypothetical protein